MWSRVFYRLNWSIVTKDNGQEEPALPPSTDSSILLRFPSPYVAIAIPDSDWVSSGWNRWKKKKRWRLCVRDRDCCVVGENRRGKVWFFIRRARTAFWFWFGSVARRKTWGLSLPGEASFTFTRLKAEGTWGTRDVWTRVWDFPLIKRKISPN